MFSPMVLFKLLLMVSLMLALSSNSSFVLWVALEFNMMSFLPLMSFSGLKMLEASMKYFLIQSLSSAMFLLCLMLGLFLSKSALTWGMMLSMAMKLGSAPFHLWFLSLMSTLHLWVLFILCTVQKVIPVLVISTLSPPLLFLYIMMLMNMAVVFSSGLVITSFNIIMALSSINNLSWMLLGLSDGLLITSLYFLIYAFLMYGMLVLFWNPMSSGPSQLLMANYSLSMTVLLTMFSLAGLPPLLGFLSKLLVIKQTFLVANPYLVICMVFSSLMVLTYYVGFSYTSVMFVPSMKSALPTKNLSFHKGLYTVVLLGFSVLSVMY